MPRPAQEISVKWFTAYAVAVAAVGLAWVGTLIWAVIKVVLWLTS